MPFKMKRNPHLVDKGIQAIASKGYDTGATSTVISRTKPPRSSRSRHGSSNSGIRGRHKLHLDLNRGASPRSPGANVYG
ncbi:uncharacterized protein A4U43_C04F23090 [Asparagus officinalis]|uniref:Uncharacterized protein n=1 Tax=Asparagus officinalis TaxID=4686 RepID=A0A5P1F317_ASPOF|nr:uncharacterized protein A4U43_C04F23090 [Asparagus officinalis]